MGHWFHRLLAVLNGIASIWILFLIALISTDVIARAGFNAPLHGVPEIVKFSLVGMVWLQMAYVLRTGGHLRTSLILDALPDIGKRVVFVLNAVIGAVMCILICWLGYIEAVRSWEIGAFEGEHPVRIPIWPIWAILVVGAALTAVQFCLDAIRYSIRPSSPAQHPPANTKSAEGP